MRTHTRTDTDLCQRCEHPADWHRHDDSAAPNEAGHSSHGASIPDDARCPMRCLGYDCLADGPVPTGGRACPCPDFVPDEPSPFTRELLYSARDVELLMAGERARAERAEARAAELEAAIVRAALTPDGTVTQRTLDALFALVASTEKP